MAAVPPKVLPAPSRPPLPPPIRVQQTMAAALLLATFFTGAVLAAAFVYKVWNERLMRKEAELQTSAQIDTALALTKIEALLEYRFQVSLTPKTGTGAK
jgi:hypothetical protein